MIEVAINQNSEWKIQRTSSLEINGIIYRRAAYFLFHMFSCKMGNNEPLKNRKSSVDYLWLRPTKRRKVEIGPSD